MTTQQASEPAAIPSVAAFLTARLDEDETAAKAATSGPWKWNGGEDPGAWGDRGPSLVSKSATWHAPGGGGPYPVTVLAGFGYDAWGIEVGDADAEHIARHDPVRVLREVEAKRTILAQHEPEPWGDPHPEWLRCPGHEEWWERWPCVEVRAIAAISSDHPDYDPAWGPDAIGVLRG